YQSRFLDSSIAIDELDPETLGLGVDDQAVTRGETMERVAAGLFVKIRARDLDGGVETIDALLEQLFHDQLAKARRQHEVPCAQELECLTELARVLVTKVRNENDESALALSSQQSLSGRQVIRM